MARLFEGKGLTMFGVEGGTFLRYVYGDRFKCGYWAARGGRLYWTYVVFATRYPLSLLTK